MTPASPDDAALSPDTLIALSYVGGWTTGLLVWLVEGDNRHVRFHAAQSVVLFGGLTVLWIVLWLGSFGALTVSASAFTVLQWLSHAVVIAGIAMWAVAMWSAWQRRSLRLPWVGRLAERLSRLGS